MHTIEVDEGWSDDRDISVFVGRWAWLDIRALVEDHGAGKGLLRVSMHLRPTSFGVVSALALALVMLVAAATGLALRWPLAGAITAALPLAIIAFAVWRTAQIDGDRRGGRSTASPSIDKMTVMRSGPARVPLIAPSLFRTYGLRSAIIFVVMIVGIGAGTFMLREAANVALVIGDQNGSGSSGPTISAYLDTPGGIAVEPSNGDIYFADSNNNVIDRIDRRSNVVTVVGNKTSGFSGDNGPATKAQLDTPDGVAIAPDGDLIVADSHNHRIRRVDKPTQVITTIAGSGESGYDGDDKPALEAALNTPNAVFVTSNGDIYIADTLNNRVRMIDHATGFISTVAGDGQTGGNGPVGDGGPATSAHLFMPSDVAVADNGDIFIADMHHNRVRKVDGRTRIITTVAGNGAFGPGRRRWAGDAGAAGGAGGHRARPRRERQGDDLHRRLLQRVHPRGRARRDHPQRGRRGAGRARRPVAGRLRAPARLALRRRFEQQPHRRAGHPEDLVAAARRAAPARARPGAEGALT